MATLNRETIEQEIGKRSEKIEKTLERTLEKTLEKALVKAQEFAATPAGQKATAAAGRAQERMASVQKTAMKSLDDVLLGLEHKGINVKQPQDIVNTVGRRVLERASEIAEDVRTQVAAQPYSPEWLKNVTDVAASSAKRAATSAAPLKDDLGSVETAATAVAGEPTTDAAVSAAGVSGSTSAAGAKAGSAASAGATEGDAGLAAQAAADGELEESLEDSAEEKSAGAIVHSEPDVVTTSLAEASKSDQASDFAAAGKTSASKKSSSKVSKTKK